jgi:uncharacterized protein YjbI with pentapeptide repeats
MKQKRNFLFWAGCISCFFTLVVAGYWVPWTGFGESTLPNGDFLPAKTLWDWMELALIPLVLALGVYYLNKSERNIEREIAIDRQQEAALQSYLDRMAGLLLNEKLRTSKRIEVRKIAQTITLATLRVLNPKRKAVVLQFLHESELILRNKPIFQLITADLRGVDLYGGVLTKVNLIGSIMPHAIMRDAWLEGANLSFSNMRAANLQEAKLEDAQLINTVLAGANLKEAYLKGADLSKALLLHADLTKAYLSGANLSEATLTDASLLNANLSDAFLVGADFTNAQLKGANLSNANLQAATISKKQLASAISLKGATMPDGTVHE